MDQRAIVQGTQLPEALEQETEWICETVHEVRKG